MIEWCHILNTNIGPELLDKRHREKVLVLSILWTTFACAFLLVIVNNF